MMTAAAVFRERLWSISVARRARPRARLRYGRRRYGRWAARARAQAQERRVRQDWRRRCGGQQHLLRLGPRFRFRVGARAPAPGRSCHWTQCPQTPRRSLTRKPWHAHELLSFCLLFFVPECLSRLLISSGSHRLLLCVSASLAGSIGQFQKGDDSSRDPVVACWASPGFSEPVPGTCLGLGLGPLSESDVPAGEIETVSNVNVECAKSQSMSI